MTNSKNEAKKINSYSLEFTEECVYLGQLVSFSKRTTEEVDTDGTTFGRLRTL